MLNKASGFLTLIAIPIVVFFAHLFSKIPGVTGVTEMYVGKGNQFSALTLVLVIILFSIDDIGTAVGLQADEIPIIAYEGNSFMVSAWDIFKDSNIVDTDTAAMRMVWVTNLFWLFTSQTFQLLNPVARQYILLFAILKALMGFQWWGLTPNNFTLVDFLSFKDGKKTPFRRHSTKVRRRLTQKQHSVMWMKNYMKYFFPAI